MNRLEIHGIGSRFRFGLPDKLRRADTASLSPNGKLVVTTDSFGRVVLIDVTSGAAVRMWKGK